MAAWQLQARSALLGLLAGLALSVARAPLGGSLMEVPANLPRRDFAWRAIALLVAAFVVAAWNRSPRVPVVALCAGAASGFGLHGLWLLYAFELHSLALLAVFVLVVAAAAHFVGKRGFEPAPVRVARAPTWAERAGYLLAGSGLALALEATARPLRLLGGSLPDDDSVFALALLVLIAFGAAAFGPLVPERVRRIAAPVLLALASAAALLSLNSLAAIADNDSFQQFIRRPPWILDGSKQGMLATDLLLGARTWLIPAFLLGTALVCARRRERLWPLLAGGAIGMLLFPWLASSMSATGDASGLDAVAQIPARRVAVGALLAAAGSAAAAFASAGASLTQRMLGSALCAFIGIAAWWAPRPSVLILSPWEQLPVKAEAVVDCDAGLLTVEPVSNGRVVTLDRRRLTPLASEEEADARRIVHSWGMHREPPQGRKLAVLLVGQLTPARARVLTGLGLASIDRTAAWHRAMEPLERALFGDEVLPPGDVLAPDVALRRVQSGAYELVLVPPTEARAPDPAGDASSAAVWIDPAEWSAHLDLGTSVGISSHGLERIAVRAGAPEGFPTGAPLRRPSPLEWLSIRRQDRPRAARAALASRLARAARGSPHEDLTAGLERLYAAQRPSSPFEWEFDQTEVDEQGLTLLSRAALASPPSPFVRELWEDLARLLADKRMPEALDLHVAPLARKYAPWPALEVALARADFELLDPASAAERLQRVLALDPYNLELQLMRGWALLLSGRSAEAVEQLRKANALQPGRRDVQRVLAIAMVHAGMPEGVASIEELLRADPDDQELEAYLQPGPPPPLPQGWRPTQDIHH